MRKYRKWREIVIEQLAADWDAALDYIQFAMEEYQVDGDTAVFLLSLRTFIESQGGVAELGKKTGMEAQTLLEVLQAMMHRALIRSESSSTLWDASFQLNR